MRNEPLALPAMEEARNYNAWLVRQVLRHAGGARTALDFGAGVGTFARPVRAHGLDVTCVELDERQRGYIDIFERAGAELIDPSCGACINAGPGASPSAGARNGCLIASIQATAISAMK